MKIRVFHILLLLGFFLIFAPSLFAQQRQFMPKSITDTTRVPSAQESTELDTVIDYGAKNIESTIDNRITYLKGDAWIRYRNMTLRAAKITIEWNKNLLTAEGIPDTVWNYTTNPGDSTMQVVYRGTPLFSEGGDVITGFKMVYNFKTKKARVEKGRTEFEGGFYFGERIKKVGEKTLNVRDGYFTTCDLEEDPHFHFQSMRMKITLQDKVIAKPVVLYIGKVPVAALPFGIFPNKSGRHSGLIIPRYGESALEGRYLRELGYYFAPSDYWDARLLVDFFEKAGFLFRGDVNYAVRYKLRGAVSGSLTRKNFTSGRAIRRWDLRIRHRQKLSLTMNLDVSGQFVSDNSFYRELSSNRQQRLVQQLNSNATLSKTWPGTQNSLTLNFSQVKDLKYGSVTTTFPRITFRHGRSQLFKGKRERKRGGGQRRVRKEAAKWYQSIYYAYNVRAINRKARNVKYGNKFTNRQGFGVDHSLNISSPQKLFGWLTVNQSLSYKETWVDRYRKRYWDFTTNTTETIEVRRFAARRTFYTRLSASTKLYGRFSPNLLGIKAIRHVVTPTISFSYRPDFSAERWGYYDTIVDTSGRVRKYDKFDGGFFGGTPRGRQQSLSFSIRNLFQMKTGEGEKEKKFDLFTLDFSSGYNFAADSLKLSDLSSSFRANPFKNLSINFNTRHSFYQFDQGRTINKLMFEKGRLSFLRLRSLDFRASLRLKGGRGRAKRQEMEEAVSEEVTTKEISQEEELPLPGSLGEVNRFEADDRFTNMKIPWNLSLTLTYMLNKANPINPTKTFRLNSDLEVNVTKNWRIRYTAQFDLVNKEIISHDIVIYRNLHCWEARFVWTPSGIGKRYYLKINVKAPLLRDLKIEKRGGRPSVLGYWE